MLFSCLFQYSLVSYLLSVGQIQSTDFFPFGISFI